VKWGFTLNDIYSMPLYEFYEYIKLINEHNEEEQQAMNNANGSSKHIPEQAKPIGMVAPRAG
jgi:hypothetical protein